MKRDTIQTDQTSKPIPAPLAHFFIYENLNYVADSKISKDQITIGRSHNADVILNHSSVADIHAFIHFEGRQAFLTNRYPDDGLHLNGKTVHLAELQHEDVIDIGPFALKIRMDGHSRSNDSVAATYCVALINRYTSDDDMQAAAQTLARQFKADPVKMAFIIAKPEFTLKKDLNEAEAERWQIALLKAGIFCEMRIMQSQPRTQVREVWSSHPDASEKPADTAVPVTASQAAEPTQVEPAAPVHPAKDSQDTAMVSKASGPAAATPVRTRSAQTEDPVAATHAAEPTQVEPDATASVQPAKVSQDTATVSEPPEPAAATPARTRSAQTEPEQLQPAAIDELPKKKTPAADGTDTPHPPQVRTTSFPTSAEPIQAQQPVADPSVEIRATGPEERPVDAAPDTRITPSRQIASGIDAMVQWDAYAEDEDEEDLWQAPFSLKEKLAETRPARPTAMPLDAHVQVVKTIGDQVVDVRFLAKGQSYTIATDAGKRCLARNKGKKTGYVCFAQDADGYVNNAKGETVADLNSYKTSDYLFKKRKQIYRVPLPTSGEINVREGQSHYRIIMAHPAQSPTVRVAQRPSDFTWRHWAISAGTHVFLVLCLSIYWYFQAITPSVSPPRFVKIDPAILQQLQPKKLPEPHKQPPPPEPEPPKPEPVKVAKKVEPPKKTPKKAPPKPVAKPVKAKRNVKRVARASRPSRHPKAGGGFGKGNIKNRNINQTGLLSVLGKTSLAGPSTAIAAVTNLDAVPVPGATDKNFSVGGVKGSLGNGKISVAGGEMLQTKSSEQVLRSSGASGPGNVAALQRGNTGKKQVQGMVTAKMSRTVKIRGGMSREMVKRVIDQHLEEITYCYETALMSNPSIMGRIVFEWKIMMSGQVGQVRVVASSVNSHEVHNCIKAAIKSWQFPKPVGAEVIVSYPFVFDLVAF